MRVQHFLLVLMAAIPFSAGAQVDSGYVPVNGIRMYYEVHGQGSIPLVLIHGHGAPIGTAEAGAGNGYADVTAGLVEDFLAGK